MDSNEIAELEKEKLRQKVNMRLFQGESQLDPPPSEQGSEMSDEDYRAYVAQRQREMLPGMKAKLAEFQAEGSEFPDGSELPPVSDESGGRFPSSEEDDQKTQLRDILKMLRNQIGK